MNEPDRNERIRKTAYELWEKEGRPAWQQERHWDEAKAIVEKEELANSRKARSPTRIIPRRRPEAIDPSSLSLIAEDAQRDHTKLRPLA